MAYRRKNVRKRRAPKRKSYRRKRMSRTTTVNHGISPISSRYLTKLKYVENFDMVFTAGDLVLQQNFAISSIFAPGTGAGTSHQPYGFDQMTPLYSKYRVYKTKWKFVYPPGMVGNMTVVPSNTITNFTTNQDYAPEVPLARTKGLSTTNSTTISGVTNHPKLFGATPAQFRANENTAAAVSASPTEFLNLALVVEDNNTTSSNTFQVQFTCEYWVEFFDPKIISQS